MDWKMEWSMEWNSGKQNSLSDCYYWTKLAISFVNEKAGSVKPAYWDPSLLNVRAIRCLYDQQQ